MYWFKCCCCIVSLTVFPAYSENMWTTTEHVSSYEKTLKKQQVYRNKKLSIFLLLFGWTAKNGHKDGLRCSFNQLRVTFLFSCLKWLF